VIKDANRRTIDHDPETMIVALAEAEHRSWMADRILAGCRKASSIFGTILRS